jgi:hypothetical protein
MHVEFTYEKYTIFFCVECWVTNNHLFVITNEKLNNMEKNIFLNLNQP